MSNISGVEVKYYIIDNRLWVRIPYENNNSKTLTVYVDLTDDSSKTLSVFDYYVDRQTLNDWKSLANDTGDLVCIDLYSILGKRDPTEPGFLEYMDYSPIPTIYCKHNCNDNGDFYIGLSSLNSSDNNNNIDINFKVFQKDKHICIFYEGSEQNTNISSGQLSEIMYFHCKNFSYDFYTKDWICLGSYLMSVDKLNCNCSEVPEYRYLVVSKKSFEHLYIVPQWDSSLDIKYTCKGHKLKIKVSSNNIITEDICICICTPILYKSFKNI